MRPPADPTVGDAAPITHVIACGALAAELRLVLHDAVAVHHLPAPLHNRPERIVDAIDQVLAGLDPVDPVVVGYADCGTGGGLDRAIDGWRAEGRSIERLPGAHCYEFLTGPHFHDLADEEPGTLYLTDFLAGAFDALVWRGLGLDRHPQLLDAYFGNYRRVVHLAQQLGTPRGDRAAAAARDAADRLGLRLETVDTTLDPLFRALPVSVRRPAGRAVAAEVG